MVAAIAALLFEEKPEADVREIRNAIILSGSRVGDPDDVRGYGLVDAEPSHHWDELGHQGSEPRRAPVRRPHRPARTVGPEHDVLGEPRFDESGRHPHGGIAVIDRMPQPLVELQQRPGLDQVLVICDVRDLVGVREHDLAEFDAFRSEHLDLLHPAEALRITCHIDFEHPVIGVQERSITVTPHSFGEELAGARTFGFLRDVEAMRRAGLALGGSYSNAVVLDDTAVLNGELRYEDEFVRHKALDLVGDLALLGSPLEGAIEVERGGHSLHQRLVQALLTEQGACEWVGHEAPRQPVGEALSAVAR